MSVKNYRSFKDKEKPNTKSKKLNKNTHSMSKTDKENLRKPKRNDL